MWLCLKDSSNLIQTQLLEIMDRTCNVCNIWEALNIAVSLKTKVSFHYVNNIHGINNVGDIINYIRLEKMSLSLA